MSYSKAAAKFIEDVNSTIDSEIPLNINCPACERDIEPQDIPDSILGLKESIASLFKDFIDDLYEELVKAVGDAVDYQT